MEKQLKLSQRRINFKKSALTFRGTILSILKYGGLLVIAAFQIIPLIWLGLFSLKNNQEIFSTHPLSLPAEPNWGNYLRVWSEGNLSQYFLNSVIYTVSAVILTILIASMVTFAVTRMKWKYSSLVLGIFIVGMMIPLHSTLIPLFKMFLRLGMTDNPITIILLYTSFNLPVTIMILLGFYQTFPRELEEAAIMDGASIHRIFFRITLPMTKPVLATAAIINMIYNWNEFVFINTFISSDRYRTLTVGIQNFVGQHSTDWGAIGATLVISILPILIIYLLLSDRIMEGLAAGSVKG